jgi:serine/threonine protein kinase
MAQPAEVNALIHQRIAGRYEIISYIAPGGFAFLFEARDLQTGADVALKVLKIGASAEDKIEFATEEDLLSRLTRQSSVVQLLGSGTHQLNLVVAHTGSAVPIPLDYLVLELADASLADVLTQRNRLNWEDRLLLFRGVVRGLHQMHLHGMVHRDIKSDNVLVFSKPGPVEARVCDLGRSRDLASPPRFPVDDYAAGRGDFRSAPPELLWLQGRNEAAFWLRVDLYLLGSVLFELATGQSLTNFVVMNPLLVASRNYGLSEKDRRSAYQAILPDLVSRYEIAFEFFENLLPPVIKKEGASMLRNLAHPDPSERGPGPRERRVANHRDLQWLLRRVDILVLRFRTSRPKWSRVKRKVS